MDVLVTFIGKMGYHIHQGFIVVPPRHPFLKELLVHAFTVEPQTLQEDYMLFCEEFFLRLRRDIGHVLKGGMNSGKCFDVYLLQEFKIYECVVAGIECDGHVVRDNGNIDILAVRYAAFRHRFGVSSRCSTQTWLSPLRRAGEGPMKDWVWEQKPCVSAEDANRF